MAAVQNRNRKQVNQTEVNRQQRHKDHQIQNSVLFGNVSRHFGNADNAADFFAAALAGNHLSDAAQSRFRHIPGFQKRLF